MYPSMPREIIVEAMIDILRQIQPTYGNQNPQHVPNNVAQTIIARRRDTNWVVSTNRNVTDICFGRRQGYINIEKNDFILAVLNSLHTCYAKCGERIIHMREGIPQGDSMSPAIAIGTCMYLEQRWWNSLPTQIRERLFIRRYLDDVLLVCDEGASQGQSHPDMRKYIENFGSKCYPNPPLSLESASDTTYLESTVINTGNDVHLRYLNKNVPSLAEKGKPVFWNVQPYHSCVPRRVLSATLSGTWCRMYDATTHEDRLSLPALLKAQELVHLHGFPLAHVTASLHRQALRQPGIKAWELAARYAHTKPIWLRRETIDLLDDNNT